MTLSGTATPGMCEPGGDGITGTSLSDCLVLYAGSSMGEGKSYPSEELQSVDYIAPANWAIHKFKCKNSFISEILVE